MTQTTRQGITNPLINHLEDLVRQEDRAGLAALRRGTGKDPGSVPHLYPHVIPYLPDNAAAWDERIAFIVASLFPLNPQLGGDLSIGGVLREVQRKRDSPKAPKQKRQGTAYTPVERRFIALLDAHPDDVHHHLRHSVRLAATEDVPIDWDRLLRDLRNWRHPARVVQRAWARDFWAPHQLDENHVSSTSDIERTSTQETDR